MTQYGFRLLRPVRSITIAAAIWGASIGIAAAQVIPPSVQPGQTQQQFKPAPAPAPVKPPISVQAPPPNAPPPGAENVRITLENVEVAGATVYSQADFAPLIKPYLNRQITLVDLYRLADEITAKYRGDGYILSRALVPAQKINKVARVDVVEGFVSEIHFQGYESSNIDAFGHQIMQSRPLRASVLERYMLLINDLSGVTGRAVLAPSPTVAGGASLTVIAQQKEIDGSVSVDNRGTKYIGPIEFTTGVGFNVPGTDDRIAARYITTPSIRELQYGELSLTHPLGNDGLRLVLYGNVVHTRPRYTLSPFNVFSDGDEATASLDYPVIRSRDQNLTVRGSFDLRDLVTVVNNNRSLSPSSDDHLRVLRFGGTYDFADAFSGINLAAAEFSQGLTILGASAQMRAVPSRPGAQTDFEKFKGEVSRQQSLAFIYPGLGFLADAEGQITTLGPLPASEQIGLGGSQWLRAYDPSDVTADNGWAAKGELQYSPPVPKFAASYLNTYQVYSFYEQGRVSRNVASVGSGRLSDAGFGLRFAFLDHLSSDLTVAKPLSRDESINLGQPHGRPWRFFFLVTAQF